MHPDVTEIIKFYEKTQLGGFVKSELSSRIAKIWPDISNLTIIGYGFTPPVCEQFFEKASRIICLMPARQGVVSWPSEGPNQSVLTHESQWPLATGIANRVIIMHGIETSLNVVAVLEECWRVLAPEGRALVIVPNRTGLWSRSDLTPFGAGRPFSASQLEMILGNIRFGVTHTEMALFGLPSQRKFWIQSSPFFEKFGKKAPFWFAGGVLLVEVHKRVFQMHKPLLKETVARGIKVLEGMTTPGARPVSNRDH